MPDKKDSYLRKYIHLADVFASNIKLNYNGETELTSTCGGVISILVGMVIGFLTYD